MKVISVPMRLRLAIGVLYFSTFWMALEVVIVSRSSWWALPYEQLAYWVSMVVAVCFLSSMWLKRARQWPFYPLVGLSSVWVGSSGWIAYRMQYPPLGFFTLFLGFYLLGALLWLRHELSRSFFHLRLKWYEGLPKPIPGLKCQLNAGNRFCDLRVSRMDRDGAFVFADGSGSMDMPKKGAKLLFSYRGRNLICEAVPVLLLQRSQGAGVRFWRLSPDLRKEIGDFVELLRGAGYEQV